MASTSKIHRPQPQPQSRTTRFLRSVNESGAASAILPIRKRYRADQVEEAYNLQRDAGIQGAAMYTALGAALTTISHFSFPGFRSQTLAFKAFIVSGFTMFGLVVGADDKLLRHESTQRSEEELIRGVARRELAKQGRVPSEKEIERWKAETRERVMRERAEAATQQQDEQDD